MAGIGLLSCTTQRRHRPTRTSRLERWGIQLYSVRAEMERDFEGTLAQLASIGFREVEFAGYFDRSPEEIKALLNRHQLVAPSAHVPIEMVRRDWSGTLETANRIGHRYVVVPYLPEKDHRTLEDYKRVAAEFNRLGREAEEAGIRFAYHNHDFEFVPLRGRIPYDVLLAETDPRYVALELDLYWIARGGQDPLKYFARYPGRFEMVHVKDSSGFPEQEQITVGQGVIDFGRIFAHRKQAGIRHAYVEHDNPVNPFAFARASYQYLERLEL